MENIKKTVREIFTTYLEEKKYRKTPERYAILDEIYSCSGHFNIEFLYNEMSAKRYRVSRATLYNTIELLRDCNLVMRHKFLNKEAVYERSYKVEEHNHMICTKCGEIFEFVDDRINAIKKDVEKSNEFTSEFSLLYVFGICKNCK